VICKTGKESDMLLLPRAAQPILAAFSVAFTDATFQRVLLLILAALLTRGRHTITALLRTLGPLAQGHFSDFHRVLSRAAWRPLRLSRILATLVLALVPEDQPLVVPVDDTNPQHKGKRVYGKGKHHDACRSTHSHTVWVWGHKWVVLAINVKFPFASRPWALPVLCALYRPEELNKAEGRRHKTPIDLARQLLAVLIHWFPRRRFILVGDGGYASHALARFCHRHRRHATLISRFHPKANLYDLPSTQQKKAGRPRLKGRKRAAPESVVKRARRRRATVSWYGGKTRRVELVCDTGHWYKGGEGLVPVRWVFVHDLDGTHRDEYFYTTDPDMRPEDIVSLYTGRWSIEVTFQEVRAHLGFATPRSWCKNSVLRTAPCLMGLFSVVSLIFQRMMHDRTLPPHQSPWHARAEPTFADAVQSVRRLLWSQTIMQQPMFHVIVSKLPGRCVAMLLDELCRPT
jgi:hypothetical protein